MVAYEGVCDQEMKPKLKPQMNLLGRDVSSHIPDGSADLVRMPPEHQNLWQFAKPYLSVRDNDVHTLYSYGIANSLCDEHPEADREVVLSAMLLHDTGWSSIAEDEILEAISPDGGRRDLVRLHEREGVRIAEDILIKTGCDATRVERILDIISEHDSLREAKNIEDAIVKDSDKLWRITPHGVDTVMDWFGLTREGAVRLIASRVHGYLHTDAARVMAKALGAVAAIDISPERIVLE